MVEFPFLVTVTPIPNSTNTPHPRYLWAIEIIGKDNFVLRDTVEKTNYWFKNEADATMFRLRWS